MTGNFAGYELLEEMGRGAAGVVYRAREAATGRPVALKLVPRELGASPGFAERFRREASAAALVADDHVARLLHAGEADGYPFLVLELVPGGSLADRLRTQGRIPWREAATLAAEVARGLAAVHAAGLVHRDVTPGNVLLDAEGRAKLADFGLVRVVGASSPAQIGTLTKTGEVVGTLEFLSPEQANGAGEVDARADLYGLGATLHALVTGAPPFQGDSYALVKQHLLARPPALRAIVPDTPAALEALVQRLLEKEPGRRGEGAGPVALELEAIADSGDGVPEPTTRRGLLAGAIALAAGGVGLGAGTFLRSRLRPAPSPAPTPSLAPSPTPSPAELLANDPDLAETREHCRTRSARLVAVWGRAAWKAPAASLAIAVSPDGTWGLSAELDWCVRRWDLSGGHIADVFPSIGQPWAFAVSPAFDRFAVSGDHRDRSIQLVEIATRQTTSIATSSVVTGLAFSPDGKRILSASRDGVLRLRDIGGEQDLLSISAHSPETGTRVSFAGNEHRVVSGSDDGTIKLWDLATAEEVTKLALRSPVYAIAPSPRDPNLALAGTHDGMVTLVSFVTGQPLWRQQLHSRGTSAVAFSPDGRTGASCGEGGVLTLFDAGSGRVVHTLQCHRAVVSRIAFTPDGRRIVTSSLDQTIGLFDAATGTDLRQVSGHRGSVLALAPARDRVLSAGNDGQLQVWDVASGRARVDALQHDAPLTTVAVTPDGRRALTGTANGVAWLWEVESGRLLGSVPAVTGPPNGTSYVRLALSPDGRRAISSEGAGAIAAWDLEPFARFPLRGPTGAPPGSAAIFLADGQAVVGGAGGELLLWDRELRTSRSLAPIEPDRDSMITTLSPHPDGKRFLAGMVGGLVRLWDVEQGRAVRTFDAGTRSNLVECVAFAPGGKTFAASYYEGDVRIWDVASSSEVERIRLDRRWDGGVGLAWLDDRSLLVGTLRGVVLKFQVS